MQSLAPNVELEQWLEECEQTRIAARQPLAGGDICETEMITTEDGREFCIKQQPAAPDDFFACEAAGLQALRENGSVRVPEVYGVSQSFIVMEYIAPGGKGGDYWPNLGAELAHLHSAPAPYFGFHHNNYCGRTLQPNSRYDNGHDFFCRERLIYQGKLALEQGYLSNEELEDLGKLCERLPELIPEQAPALLHGDLWSGNIHSDVHHRPVLLDPACYWGWPEADIAMTRLFGGFPESFYQGYQQVRSLEPGWQGRTPIYNLYHLLNHLNLFGSSYHPSVTNILDHYV